MREFQLRYRVRYQVLRQERDATGRRRRDLAAPRLSFNDQDPLAKESEEALLYRDMQTDMVQQIVRGCGHDGSCKT